MKLLLDENLSPALVAILSELYPQTAHVRDFGLKSASDPTVWEYAAKEGYTIVTKDADFHHRSFLFGSPPRVIWIRLGNCSTQGGRSPAFPAPQGNRGVSHCHGAIVSAARLNLATPTSFAAGIDRSS